jgi:hypothetical protein
MMVSARTSAVPDSVLTDYCQQKLTDASISNHHGIIPTDGKFSFIYNGLPDGRQKNCQYLCTSENEVV